MMVVSLSNSRRGPELQVHSVSRLRRELAQLLRIPLLLEKWYHGTCG